MLQDPATAGPHDPRTPAPPRSTGSVRRTSTIDTHRPDGLTGPSLIDARARDLWTARDGSPTVVAVAEAALRLDGPAHRLDTITSDPSADGLDALVGAVVGPGFRAKVDRAAPELRDSGSLLYLLLDDLPGATLVSGYSMLHAGVVGTVVEHDEYLDARGDLCAGWAVDASMMRTIKELGVNPIPVGPAALALTEDDDPLAFHPVAPLAPFGMRRLRRLDVMQHSAAAGGFPVEVFFRDSHVDGDGSETIVHEYSVSLTVDGVSRTVVAIDATADVLPWIECPGALGSAQRLVGRTLTELRPWVRQHLVGTTTCTHLNDVLRGLADVDHLLDVLAAQGEA